MSSAFVAVKILSAVKVMSPARLLVTSFNVPPASVNASAPTVTLLRSRVAPDATVVRPVVLPRPLLFVTINVPASTAVTPSYVLAPLKVKVPAPVLVKPPLPAKMALIVVSPELLVTL